MGWVGHGGQAMGQGHGAGDNAFHCSRDAAGGHAHHAWRVPAVGGPIEFGVHNGWVHAGPVGGGCQVVLVDTVFQAVGDPACDGSPDLPGCLLAHLDGRLLTVPGCMGGAE